MAVFISTPLGAEFPWPQARRKAVPTPGIPDHGETSGDAFRAKNAQVGGILHTEGPEPMGAASGITGGRQPAVDQLAGSDEIVVGVGEDHEAFFDEDARGFDKLLRVLEKSVCWSPITSSLTQFERPTSRPKPRRAEWLRLRVVTSRGYSAG